MRVIPKPTTKTQTVFNDCVYNSRKKTDYESCLPQINSAEIELETISPISESFRILTKTPVSPSIGKNEMIKLYDDKMSKITEKARTHYDTIFMSAKGGICPLCSQGIVKTLDHFLPKSEYPIYSITPVNLIPCCRDCNIDKSVALPTSEETTHIHPYFDNVENENWLKMGVNHTSELLFEFYVECPQDWSILIKNRLEFHLTIFDLYNRYSKHAAQAFENKKVKIAEIYTTGGTAQLKEHLYECYQTKYRANKNSWQTAFYLGLFADEWFCNGGFANII